MLTSTTNPPEDIADWELPPRPDVSHLITEDGTPVGNIFSEKQMRLLTESIHTSWQPGFPFLAMANVGVYVALNRPPIVPDVLVKTHVEPHADPWEKDHRAYFAWTYDGKPPDVVIEIVSNTKGGELDTKLRNYQQIGVPWYIVYDPQRCLGEHPLTAHALNSTSRRLLEGDPVMLGSLGLGVRLWEGTFEGMSCTWLRWCGVDGNILLTGQERAAEESKRATAESKRATAESKRATALAAKLRELGVDPDSI